MRVGCRHIGFVPVGTASTLSKPLRLVRVQVSPEIDRKPLVTCRKGRLDDDAVFAERYASEDVLAQGPAAPNSK